MNCNFFFLNTKEFLICSGETGIDFLQQHFESLKNKQSNLVTGMARISQTRIPRTFKRFAGLMGKRTKFWNETVVSFRRDLLVF
jgi:hypothetical protein